MKTTIVRIAAVLIALAVLAIGSYYAIERFYVASPMKIIAINKSAYSYSAFWEVVRAGMDEAIEEYDLEMMFMHPDFEYQIEEQKVIIEEAIAKEPDVIILVASDYYEIGPYAKQIIDTGIELLLLDSDVIIPEDADVPFVGTNSLKAGEYLGNMASDFSQLSDATDKALLLVHYFGVQTSDDREQGIRTGFGNDRIAYTYSCDSDEEIAYQRTKETLLEDETISIVFGTNENVTIGAARAIEELNMGETVQLYGFDGSQRHVQFLEKGIIDYTIIQSPYQMGYLAVVNAMNLGHGVKVEEFVETDFLPIGKDNMYDVGFREILFPFITE